MGKLIKLARIKGKEYLKVFVVFGKKGNQHQPKKHLREFDVISKSNMVLSKEQNEHSICPQAISDLPPKEARKPRSSTSHT